MNVHKIVILMPTGQLQMVVTRWAIKDGVVTFYDQKEVIGQFSLSSIFGWVSQMRADTSLLDKKRPDGSR